MRAGGDATEDVSVGDDENGVLGAGAEPLTDPLGSLVQGGFVCGELSTLGSPVWGEEREVEGVEL